MKWNILSHSRSHVLSFKYEKWPLREWRASQSYYGCKIQWRSWVLRRRWRVVGGAKMTSEFVFFPSLNHIKIEKCLLLIATNTNIFTLRFKETHGKVSPGPILSANFIKITNRKVFRKASGRAWPHLFVILNFVIWHHPICPHHGQHLFLVFMWSGHIPKLKITFPSEVLVSLDKRPYRNLTFHNISRRQGSFCNEARLRCVTWKYGLRS